MASVAYLYDVDAADPNLDDTLSFFLEGKPDGMTINPTTGLIQWTPTKDQLGEHAIALTVQDSGGLIDTQEFILRVVADTEAPTVAFTVDPPFADPGEIVTITVLAEDNVSIAEVNATLDGTGLPLDQNGQTLFSNSTPGVFEVLATATDNSGNQTAKTAHIRIRDANDTAPPVASLNDPEDLAKITYLTDLIGTATDDNFFRYQLGLVRIGDDAFTIFAEGTAPVENGVLTNFDPTLLQNGMYRVRLVVEDLNGLTALDERVYRVDGAMKVGLVHYDFLDLQVPLAGVPITIVRTYDNRVKNQGDFGIAWTLSILSGTFEHNRTPGVGWRIDPSGGTISLPCRTVVETESHLTEVRLSDTEYYEFRMRVTDPAAVIGGCLAEAGYEQVGGSSLGASLQILDGTGLLYRNGIEEVLNESTLLPFDPQRVRLITPEGTEVDFDRAFDGQVTAITDRNGNNISIDAGGIMHSSGIDVTFNRDALGRIESIVDPNGDSLLYEYDDYGDLVRFTDTDGEVQTYVYDTRHNMTEIQSQGTGPVRMVYDGDGRLIQVIDTAGNVRELSHDIENRTEVSTDALGNVTIHEYDPRGNIVSKTDALGNVTSYTYDADDNQTSVTDPLGRVTRYTWDANGNKLSKTAPDGAVRSWAYNADGSLASETDALGNISLYTYDGLGNLLTRADPLGNSTTYTYDGDGNRLTETDCAGNVTAFTYDGRGNMMTKTDPLGSVTTYTYDNNGNQLTETRTRMTGSGPVAMTTTREYNARGQVTREVDPNGNVTATEYHPSGFERLVVDRLGHEVENEYGAVRGAVVRRIHQDGGVATNVFDAQGNLASSTDEDGNTTRYEYDGLNRLVRTTLPDGAVTSMEYDAAGQLSAQIDANGNRTEVVYDGLARLTRVTDPLGNAIEYRYDLNGNRTAMIDARGNETRFEYDALNRRTRTIFADGSTRTTAYIGTCAATRSSETDQSGSTTHFEYDGLDRLVQVIDAMDGVTEYIYDELGNRLMQTDANGNTTRFEYDNLGKAIKRTLPLGQTETMTYDANGNRVSRTDFNGDTTIYSYDGRGNLVLKDFPDGESMAYRFSPRGLRTSAGDNTFVYNPAGRLSSDTGPAGVLSYTYDAAGNRLSVTTPEGTTSYGYDAMNRPATVTDPAGGVTTYTYDANGNRAGITYPNGTATEYIYDTLNHLTQLRNLDAAGSPLSVYDYTLGPAGNRLRVDESGPATRGRSVAYEYDSLYRLIEERIDEPGTANDKTVTYTYDAIGNRTQRTVTTGARTATTVFTYDANDRLVEESTTVSFGTAMFVRDNTVQIASLYRNSYMWLSIAGIVLGLFHLLYARRGRAHSYDGRLQRPATLMLIFPVVAVLVFGPGVVHALAGVGQFPGEAPITAGESDVLDDETITYTYDENGNMIGRSDGSLTDTYDYDFENRLVTSTVQMGPNPGSYAYEYNADGTRITMAKNGAWTDYLVDANRPLPQVLVETNDSETVTYVYGDNLISQTRPVSGTSYYHYDGHMSVRQLTDSAAAVTDTYTYDAFGTLLDATGATENNYLYSGEQYDPNIGFYYLRARYYNASSGRFLSQDPLLGSVFDPVTLHRYLYANANPVMFKDPTGMTSLLELTFTRVIIGIFAAIAQQAYGAIRDKLADFKTPIKWSGVLTSSGLSVKKPAGFTLIFFIGESECRYSRISHNQIKMPIKAMGITFGFAVPIIPSPLAFGFLAGELEMKSFGWRGPSKFVFFGIAVFAGAAVVGGVPFISFGSYVQLGDATGYTPPSFFDIEGGPFGINLGARLQVGFSTQINNNEEGSPCEP